MATGINYDDPEIQKGMELFETLFRDRPEVMREPTPQREEIPPEEEKQRGMELFETLFYDRLHPPEVPEEIPQPEEPESPEEIALEPDPSPMKEATPPRPRRPPEKTPPKWLTHSMDRDTFTRPRHPDWFARFHDPYNPAFMTPPRRHSLIVSPPLLDVESDESFDENVFSPLPPPKPEPEPEPPIPEGEFCNSFEEALNQMHYELQKYPHDEKNIRDYVRMAPLIRDYNLLTTELLSLVKLYLPEVDTEGLQPEWAVDLLEKYMKDTERKIRERYEEPFEMKYTDISEEVMAAMVRLHKERALEAIDTYKKQYFVLKKEIDEATAKLEKLRHEKELREIEKWGVFREVRRLGDEERAAAKEYAEGLWQIHMENCPYRKEFKKAVNRYTWLKKAIPRYEQELEKSRVAYERDVANLQSWITLFPPNLVKGIQELIKDRLKRDSYEPVPMERYMKLADNLTKDLHKKKEGREHDLRHHQWQCKKLNRFLNEKEAELEEARGITNELEGVQNNLKTELLNIRLEDKKRSDLLAQLLVEKFHYQTYTEMLLGKIIALDISAPSQSKALPSTSDLGSRSPSPVGSPPGAASSASPPAMGSGMFDITQIESSPRFDDSLGLLGDERPPSEMLNISDLSRSGGSDASVQIPQGQDESFSLQEERPPSERLNISDLSESGGSPASEWIPAGKTELDNLYDERPPSEMMNISDLSGSGSPFDSLEGTSPLDSLERSASSLKKTFVFPSPGKEEQLRMDVEIIPQNIKRSPSGQRVVCDLAVEIQEAAARPPRGIERRKVVVRGTPPISQTVGRRFDRQYGMFTPQSSFRRRHVGVRRPLFEGDFESPVSPWGTGRRTHPELLNLTPHVRTPPSPGLDRTIEWEIIPK